MTKTLIVTSIIITTLFLLTSCSLFGTANPHTEGLMLPPKTLEGTTLPVGDIESGADTTLIITPSTWFENVEEG